MSRIKAFLAILPMMIGLRLVLRKDSAESLRIAIPLTLAIVTAMEVASPTGLAKHRGVLHDTLVRMRRKLSALEGGDPVPA